VTELTYFITANLNSKTKYVYSMRMEHIPLTNQVIIDGVKYVKCTRRRKNVIIGKGGEIVGEYETELKRND